VDDKIKIGKKEIDTIKEKIKTAKTRAKIDYEKSLAILENKQGERENKLHLKEELLRQKEEKLKSMIAILKKEEDLIDQGSIQNKIKRLLNDYQKKYETPFYKIDFDENKQYFVVKERKNGNIIDSLHRWLYKRKIDSNLSNKEIHHIDNDVLNNELYNLIALAKEEHNKEFGRFLHLKITKGDWYSGIKQLQEQLHMKKEDFPKHIQEHMTQTKL
jgi:hypothetical protein